MLGPASVFKPLSGTKIQPTAKVGTATASFSNGKLTSTLFQPGWKT